MGSVAALLKKDRGWLPSTGESGLSNQSYTNSGENGLRLIPVEGIGAQGLRYPAVVLFSALAVAAAH